MVNRPALHHIPPGVTLGAMYDDLATELVSANENKVQKQGKINGAADAKVTKLAFQINDNKAEIEAARRIAEKINDLVS